MRTSILLAFILTLAGCATIMQGSKQGVSMGSSPTGALVTVDGQNLGITPMVASLKRNNTHVVRMSMPGYETYEITLAKKTSGWVWGNLAFGGIPGLIVDLASGALYKLTPEQVSANFNRTTAMLDGDQLYLGVTLTPDLAWEKVGQLTRE